VLAIEPSYRRSIFVGLSGASGAIVGIRVLSLLRDTPGVETHLVVSPAAGETIALETDWSVADVKRLATVVYRFGDVAAGPSSGTFPIDAALVIPCSVRTASAIAYSLDDNLLVRAADVALKERRPLVLGIREAPLHLGHLRTLTQLSEMGATIFPLMPAFYTRPADVNAIADQLASRALRLAGVRLPDEHTVIWRGPKRSERGSETGTP
jgi:4-hydroxy-3-polyprenylbenzoate decarboxylase